LITLVNSLSRTRFGKHLFGVALINMNGRLYDARLHRFLFSRLKYPFLIKTHIKVGWLFTQIDKYVSETHVNVYMGLHVVYNVWTNAGVDL